jgi:hypothetical protein
VILNSTEGSAGPWGCYGCILFQPVHSICVNFLCVYYCLAILSWTYFNKRWCLINLFVFYMYHLQLNQQSQNGIENLRILKDVWNSVHIPPGWMNKINRTQWDWCLFRAFPLTAQVMWNNDLSTDKNNPSTLQYTYVQMLCLHIRLVHGHQRSEKVKNDLNFRMARMAKG